MALAKLLGDRRLGLEAIEAVKGAGYDGDLAGYSGGVEAAGVLEVFVVKQVEGADADPGRREPREIFSSCRSRILRDL